MEFQFSSDGCVGGDNQVDKLEHVVLTVSFIHRRRGDLSLLLISPSGTKSELLSTRRYDDSKEGLDEWKFMTVHFWGTFECQTKVIFYISSLIIPKLCLLKVKMGSLQLFIFLQVKIQKGFGR